VHALPVMAGLRRRYPQAHIAWLIGKSFAPLLKGHPDIDELIVFDRQRYARLARSPSTMLEFARFVRDLRRRQFELVIDLQGLFRSGFFARASAAPVRIGFAAARELAPVFYTHKLPHQPPDTHAVDRNFAVAELLGFADAPKRFDLALRDEERHEVNTLLAEIGLSPTARFVAVLPGARWETKQWPAERFVTVIDRLAKVTGLRTLLLGGASEVETCRMITAACQSAPACLAGRTRLRQLATIIERATAVVCHDSGPLHLAAALDRPIVCLSGPTNPRRTGPYGRPECVIRLDLPCSPCYLRKLSQCRFQHECMQKLSPDEVSAKLLPMLEPFAVEADSS
jgi:heptosyltransferase-1